MTKTACENDENADASSSKPVPAIRAPVHHPCQLPSELRNDKSMEYAKIHWGKRFLQRALLASFWLLGGVGVCSADEMPAPPEMPSEITLTDGVVLHKVSVVRWTKDYVVLRHLGGADPIRYENIANPKPDVIQAIRAAATKAATSKPAAALTRTISGQVSVTAQDVGVYKFRGITVAAYRLDQYQAMADSEAANLQDGWRLQSPKVQARVTAFAWIKALADHEAVASTTTDADGNYSLTIPADTPVFLVCHADRLVRSLRVESFSRESNLWVVHPGDAARLDLNDSNQWVQPE